MTNKLNVLQIIDSLEVGGAEVMAVNIANGLSDRKKKSHICVTRKEGLLKRKIDNSVEYLYLNKKKVIDVKATLKLKKYVKEHSITIIHAHSSSFLIAILVKILIPSIKIVWHDHYGKAENIEKRNFKALKLSSLFFNSIISVNNILFLWAKEHLFTKKIKYVANFSVLNKLDVKKTILKGIEGKRIICLAVFRPQKDHLNLLAAFLKLQNNFPEYTLHLVGQYKNDTYNKKIKEFIKHNHLQKKVFIYGAVLDISHVLSQADIAVLSSSSEGLPVSLLEYGLAGLSVVVTNVGECKNVVNGFGLIVEKNNSMALFLALEQYIKDKELRMKMGKNFKKHIESNYSEKIYFDKLIEIYREC